MSRTPALLISILILSSFVASCDDQPTGPNDARTTTTPPPPDPGSPPRPVSTLTSLELFGPEDVGQGETADLSLVARVSEPGSLLEYAVGTEATWVVEPAHVLTLVGPGRIRGAAGGAGTVTAAFRDRRATLNVIVVPVSHHRLLGSVYEDPLETPVPDARVEVKGDPDNVSFTDFSGGYRLIVPPGTVTVRITKDGYRPLEQRVRVQEHTAQHFELQPIRSQPRLSGRYTLTISAAEECRQSPGWPEELSIRQYVATVDQEASMLHVRLSGATFAFNSDGQPAGWIGGTVTSDSVRFRLSPRNPWTESEPTVVEETGPSRYLVISGDATVDLPVTRQTGLLNGRLELLSANPWSSGRADLLADCTSGQHRFRLSQ